MVEVTLDQALNGIDRRIENALAALRKGDAPPAALMVCDNVYRPLLKTVAICYSDNTDPEHLRRALMAAFAGGLADMAAAMYPPDAQDKALDFLQLAMNDAATAMQREFKARFPALGTMREAPPAGQPATDG